MSDSEEDGFGNLTKNSRHGEDLKIGSLNRASPCTVPLTIQIIKMTTSCGCSLLLAAVVQCSQCVPAGLLLPAEPGHHPQQGDQLVQQQGQREEGE